MADAAVPVRRVARRQTDVQKLCGVIERQPQQRASKTLIMETLGWTPEKLERVIARAIDDSACAVARVQGGRSIRFRGGERYGGANGVGLYNDLKRVIERHWAPKRHCREIELDTVGSPRRRSGQLWITPDLVMRCHPGRKATPDQPKQVHAIEVETARGFDIKSVYQAHAMSRGADYSWVFFERSASGAGAQDHPDWERIMWGARTLGIGLVSYTNPSAFRNWRVEQEAARLKYTRAERRAFDEVVSSR